MNMNDATRKGNDESQNVMTSCQHCADDLDRTNGQILTLVLRLPLRYVDAVSVPPFNIENISYAPSVHTTRISRYRLLLSNFAIVFTSSLNGPPDVARTPPYVFLRG